MLMKNINTNMSKIFLTYKLENGDYRQESVWASKVGSNYRIENTPFFAKNISYGDLVSVENDNGKLYFLALISASEHSTIQVVFFDTSTFDKLVLVVEGLGASWEGLDERKRYISINFPSDKNYSDLKNVLDYGLKNGDWDYRESCLGKNHQ